MIFQSTLPVWGATLQTSPLEIRSLFQSTLPVWGATDGSYCRFEFDSVISIHAPRVGSDVAVQPRTARLRSISIHAPRVGSDSDDAEHIEITEISIHAPRVGSDIIRSKLSVAVKEFQSTLPVWGATRHDRKRKRVFCDFNPRSPCGERQDARITEISIVQISIHAPRVGSDIDKSDSVFIVYPISIHAPRVGSDTHNFIADFEYVEISIHAPRVGSDARKFRQKTKKSLFQSTLPVWGATC